MGLQPVGDFSKYKIQDTRYKDHLLSGFTGLCPRLLLPSRSLREGPIHDIPTSERPAGVAAHTVGVATYAAGASLGVGGPGSVV